MGVRRVGKSEGFTWIAIGIAISIISWQAVVGNLHEPGPGFVGFVAGLFCIVVGLIMVLPLILSKTSSSYNAGDYTPFRVPKWPRLAYTVALLVAYGLLLDWLGYVVTTFFVMWGLFYDRENSTWYYSGFASLACVAVTYLVFDVWLRCQFPRGIFP